MVPTSDLCSEKYLEVPLVLCVNTNVWWWQLGHDLWIPRKIRIKPVLCYSCKVVQISLQPLKRFMVKWHVRTSDSFTTTFHKFAITKNLTRKTTWDRLYNTVLSTVWPIFLHTTVNCQKEKLCRSTLFVYYGVFLEKVVIRKSLTLRESPLHNRRGCHDVAYNHEWVNQGRLTNLSPLPSQHGHWRLITDVLPESCVSSP